MSKRKVVQYVLNDDTAQMVKVLAARQRLTQSEVITRLVEAAWVEEARAVVKEAKKVVARGQ